MNVDDGDVFPIERKVKDRKIRDLNWSDFLRSAEGERCYCILMRVQETRHQIFAILLSHRTANFAL